MHKTFEAIQYYLMKASNELAKERGESVMQALDLGYNVVVNLASTRAVLPDNVENVLTELKDQHCGQT